MADEEKGAAATEAQASDQVFKIQRIYLKDASFESPLTPKIFTNQGQWQPQVALNLHTETAKLENDLYEVVLTVTVTVKNNDETVYLTEVKQAGLFMAKGIPDERMGPLMGSFCPTQLFPFAREEITSLVQKGGFPQLPLEPVNFDALYAQHLKSQREAAAGADANPDKSTTTH